MRKSIIFSFLLIIVSTFFLSINMWGKTYQYEIGQVPTESVYSPRVISYEIKEETEKARHIAEESVPHIFDRDTQVLTQRIKMVNVLFYNIKTVKRDLRIFDSDDIYFQVKRLSKKLPSYLRYDDRVLRALTSYHNPDDIKRVVLIILKDIFDNGILSEPYDNPLNLKTDNVKFRSLPDPKKGTEVLKKLNDIHDIKRLKKKLKGISREYTQKYTLNQQWAIYLVIRKLVKPNLSFNNKETKILKKEAREKIQPVKRIIQKNEIIIEKGKEITPENLIMVQALNEKASKVNIKSITGIFLIQFIFFCIISFFMFEKYTIVVPDKKAPYIVNLLLIVYVIYTFFVFKTFQNQDEKILFSLFAPISFVTIVLSILYNVQVALLSGLFIIFYTMFLSGGDIGSFGLALSSALIGIFGTKKMETRTDFLRLGSGIVVINSLIILAVALLKDYSDENVLDNILLAVKSGFANSLMALGLLPVFEHAFGICTKFRLLELTDLHAPIFKKMLMKAPGTYNHSIMVANMAEAACKEIKANYLLARVGGYYHDIGKLESSDLYIENKKNPAKGKSKLSPREYSLKIIEHVTKGAEKARELGLPQQVIDFIQEHHGDTLMTFFYHQALEEADKKRKAEEVHKSDFTYPGPKPRSRETAIIMLADAIEAASRSIQDPTSVKLETLVKKIIFNKLNEGSLEDSNLTMKELRKVQRAFLSILNGIFHTRLEYPEKEDIQKLEKKVKKSD